MKPIAPVFVEIADEPIIPGRTWTDRETGTVKPIPPKQNAYVHVGLAHPIPFTVSVPDGASPFKPGRYLLGGKVFEPGENGRLTFKPYQMELVSLEDAEPYLNPTQAKAKAA